MLKFIFIFITGILFLPLSSVLYAEQTFSIEDLTRIALKKSRQIRAKEAGLKSIDGAVKQTKSWQNPDLSVVYGNKSESSSSLTGIGNERSSGYYYSIAISQPFYAPGKNKSQIKVQETLRQDAKVALDETVISVYMSVIYLSYGYKEILEHLEHMDERYKRFSLIYSYLNSRAFVSSQKRTEKYLIENQMRMLEKEIQNEKIKKEIIWKKLNVYLELEKPVSIKAGWFSKGHPLNREDILKNIKENPLLKKQRILLERKKIENDLAKTEKYPDYEVSAIYSEEKATQRDRYMGAGLTFRLPVWNRSKGNIAFSEAELNASREESIYLENKIITDLEVMFIEYENRRSIIQKLPLRLIETVHREMREADLSFRKGQLDISVYLELEKSASELHAAVFDSQLEYVESYLKILSMTGRMNFQEEK